MTNMNQHEIINKNLDIQITVDAASQEHPHPSHSLTQLSMLSHTFLPVTKFWSFSEFCMAAILNLNLTLNHQRNEAANGPKGWGETVDT